MTEKLSAPTIKVWCCRICKVNVYSVLTLRDGLHCHLLLQCCSTVVIVVRENEQQRSAQSNKKYYIHSLNSLSSDDIIRQKIDNEVNITMVNNFLYVLENTM